MHCLVYEYEVDPRQVALFEQTYGPDGDWARFFRGGTDYLRTELLRDSATPGRYVVLDRWVSAETAGAFLAEHADEYARRSAETAEYYLRERQLGAFDGVDGQ